MSWTAHADGSGVEGNGGAESQEIMLKLTDFIHLTGVLFDDFKIHCAEESTPRRFLDKH